MLLKVAWVVLICALAYYVLDRNSRANFQPPFRSKLELFCAGFVSTFPIVWLMATDLVFWTRIMISFGSGILGGIGLAYTFPRHFHEIQAKINKDKETRKQNNPNNL